MKRIDNNGSVLKFSLLALAIVAVAGCSSNDSSSQPLNPGDGTVSGGSGSSGGETDGGGTDGGGSGSSGGETDGGGTDGGSDNGDSGSGGSGTDSGGGQSFTYGTVNPADDIPTGEVFALDSTTIKATEGSDGVTINSGPTVGANATITVLEDTPEGNTVLRLQDPDNGIDVELFEDSDGSTLYTNGEGDEIELFSQGDSVSSLIPSGGLNYAAYGFWFVPADGDDIDVGFFAGGYATQTDDMPDMGTATFSGAANGFSVAADGTAVDVIGNASMNVDFGAGTLTGAMTGMTSGPDINGALNSTTPWNDVDFNGTLTDNTFSADADVRNSPDNAAALDGDAEGRVNGRFYGPQAAEAAGTWSLEDGSGGTSFGAFGVKQ